MRNNPQRDNNIMKIILKYTVRHHPGYPKACPFTTKKLTACRYWAQCEHIQMPPTPGQTDETPRFQELPTSAASYLDKQQLQTILKRINHYTGQRCRNGRETEEETRRSTFIAAEEGRGEKAQRNPTRTFLP